MMRGYGQSDQSRLHVIMEVKQHVHLTTLYTSLL